MRGQDGTAALKVFGSGGGAGGSVQIVTKNIAGDAIIDLEGGEGSSFGGGGGAGGRFISHLLQNFNSSNHNQSLHWNGTINMDGGQGGPIGVKIAQEVEKVLQQSND